MASRPREIDKVVKKIIEDLEREIDPEVIKEGTEYLEKARIGESTGDEIIDLILKGRMEIIKKLEEKSGENKISPSQAAIVMGSIQNVMTLKNELERRRGYFLFGERHEDICSSEVIVCGEECDHRGGEVIGTMTYGMFGRIVEEGDVMYVDEDRILINTNGKHLKYVQSTQIFGSEDPVTIETNMTYSANRNYRTKPERRRTFEDELGEILES